MKKQKRRSRSLQNGPSLFLFLVFLVVALLTVMALEYIEYRGGRYSFIFTHLIRPKPAEQKGKRFHPQLEQLLGSSGYDAQYLQDSSGSYHVRIITEGSRHSALQAQIRDLVKKEGGRFDLVDSKRTRDGAVFLYRIAFGKIPSHLILLTTVEAEKRVPAAEKKGSPPMPKIAFIIDDIGYTETGADQLHNLGLPVTAAIIPDAPFAALQAEKIRRFGLEQIIHLPMQSKNGQNQAPPSQFVTAESTPEEIAALVRRARKVVFDARGVNNHMGSLVTSRADLMERVLREIKRDNLFFIDSRTTADSVAYDAARALGIKTIYRDIFLDSLPGYDHAREQIRQLVELARSRGQALAIGHPLDTTLKALRDARDWIRSQNVEVVFVSSLLN